MAEEFGAHRHGRRRWQPTAWWPPIRHSGSSRHAITSPHGDALNIAAWLRELGNASAPGLATSRRIGAGPSRGPSTLMSDRIVWISAAAGHTEFADPYSVERDSAT